MLLNCMLEKTLESPLDCKEIQPVNPKGNQSWIFTGRTDAEAPILWPPDVKNWLIWKDPDAGKDWKWEEKGTTENEMVGWHHQLKGHECEQALGVGYKEAWHTLLHRGGKDLDTTERLNWTKYFLGHTVYTKTAIPPPFLFIVIVHLLVTLRAGSVPNHSCWALHSWSQRK